MKLYFSWTAIVPLIVLSLQLSVACSQNPISPRATPWKSSRLLGTPDPPLPYKITRVFPEVKLAEPTDISWVPAAERWVATQVDGQIFSFGPDSQTASTTPLLDLNALHSQPIHRAYATTFHPDLERQPWCFVTYSSIARSPEGTHLVRFRVTDTRTLTIDPNSREVLANWSSSGHAGGSMCFGPDGYFYVSVGDGQNPYPPDALNTGQDIGDLEASILRIDVSHSIHETPYQIPPDNPFVSTPGARPEIWAFGFRNPWKMSFNPQTAELFAGDIGWEMREMIYRVEKGANYGWSIMEGSQPVKPELPSVIPITPPLFEHSHIDARSITGGYFWQSGRNPDLAGAYIYGDWMTGKVWALRARGSQILSHIELVDTPLQVICFMLDPTGEVLVVGYDGSIWRLEANLASSQQLAFPTRLSETGLFANVEQQIAAAGVVEYEINAHHWADGTHSRQWIALPDSEQLELFETSEWQTGQVKGRFQFPRNTVFAKTISYDAAQPASSTSTEQTFPANDSAVNVLGVPTRLETQILHRVDEEWRAYNYVWNEEQTDALLQDDKAVDRTLLISDQTASGGRKSIAWHHASRSECLLCHIWSAGTVHGFLPEQLDMRWPAQDPPQQDRSVQEVSQVARLANLGLFRKPLPAVKRLANPHDINEPLEARARSYLAVNCSTCHRPLGGGTANFDFELTRSLSENNFLDALPAQGTFSIPDARVVARGAPVRSVLLYRMLKSGRGHMPQFGSSLTDRKGVSLISDWIASLDSSDFSHSPGIDVPSWQEAVADLQHTADLEQTIATHLRTTSGAIALSLICNLGVIADQTRAKIVEMGAATTDPVIRDLFEHFLPEDQRVKRLGTSFDEAALLALPGSVEQGERLFATSAEITCRQCHRIGQVGNAVGPDLDGVGLQMTSAELLASILHPSEKVDPRYRGRVILTTDGQIITGIVASESQQAITLIDSTGKPQIIPMESIEQMQSGTKSIMPELLFSGLTERQAADLLAFLSEQKRPGPLHHKQAQIPRIHQPLNIDGKLDEPAWARAPSLGDFVFTWWTDGDLPQQQTDARLLWDENYLYVSFKCWDRDVRATRELRDSDVYRDDCVEIFASPEIDHPTHYFNLEMNARGVQLDNYRPAGQEPANAWNPDGIQIAVQIDGTLNQSDDEDRSWTLEAAIPFKLFAHVLPDGHPRNGERWRLNLNRLEGEMAQKSQWSQGDRNIPRFHTPDLFGFVQFVGADTQISSPYSSVDPVRQAGEPKLLRSGFTFTEGPVWIASQQALLFSDVRENVTWRYRSPDIFDRYIENTGGGNGLAITPEHELIMCQVESRQLAKLQLPLSPEGVPPTLTSLTSLFDGREAGLGAGKYNQTNDAIARSDGTIYFTDPAYRPHTRELDFTGVYRLTPEGKVVLVSKDYYPNGIALSPDERWLYIVNRNHIERLQLAEDGSAMQAETLLETTSDGDGMAVDDAGNLYIATTAIEVFSASGKPYGAIKLPGSGLTNCTFGGPHRKTLFATTADSLTAIEMPIPGLP